MREGEAQALEFKWQKCLMKVESVLQKQMSVIKLDTG